MTTQQLVMERRGQQPTASDASGIKNILVHVIDDDFLDERIESALSLARACSAHVSFLHVTPIEAYVAFEGFGGVLVMNDVIRNLDERDGELKKNVEERLGKEDVSWDYEQVTGNVASILLSRASLADLVITAREPPHHDVAGPAIGFLGDVLHRSRTPLFIPALPQARVDPAGVAVIAWDGSIEAANAVRASVGLLRLASGVQVVQVPEEKPKANAFPGTKLLEYLSRHEIHAELFVEPSPASDAGHDLVAATIVAQARGAQAAYIVMGGYSHTRIGEYIFGGVTRALLKECPVPLLIAH